MDRHLNAFVPYERPPIHEDQLTRAAMIVLRAIPLARDAFLGRIGCPSSGQLPDVEMDMQARNVLEPTRVEAEEAPSLGGLVSVFLSPDEGLDLAEVSITERVTEQRLDGVLRFGDELVVVIESKIVGAASPWQAGELRLRGVEVDTHCVEHLGWHDLLRDWWGLVERGLLAPAERLLIEDLAGFAEEHFPHLLPFSTLAEAGEHELRRQRRLLALLREAVGVDKVRRRPSGGAEAMLTSIGAHSIQRIMLERQGGDLVLGVAAAELKAQAVAFYGTLRAKAAADLAYEDGWEVAPNLHLAYRGALTRAQRLYTHCVLPAAEYVRRFTEEDLERVGGYAHDRVRDQLWPWLRERSYASPADEAELDDFLERLGRRDAHLRPSLRIARRWPWSDAEDLDQRGLLTDALRDAVTLLLTRLNEPMAPTCR